MAVIRAFNAVRYPQLCFRNDYTVYDPFKHCLDNSTKGGVHKPSVFSRKTGAGEGIRTLDPNLGKIRLDEILHLDQIVISLLENPNTIRTFSAEFPQKALCSGFQTSAERQLRAQLPPL